MKQVLYIIRGLPGSGKTTLAKTICATVHSADDYFIDENGIYQFDNTKLMCAHVYCKAKVIEHMILNEPVAVANTFTRESEIQEYLDLAKTYGYMVFSIIIENRHDGVSVHDVPESTIEKMRDRFSIKL